MLTLRDEIYVDLNVNSSYVGKYMNYTVYRSIDYTVGPQIEVFNGRIYCATSTVRLYLNDIANNVAYRADMLGDKNIQNLHLKSYNFTFKLIVDAPGTTESVETDTIYSVYPLIYKKIEPWQPEGGTIVRPKSMPFSYNAHNGDILYPRIPSLKSEYNQFFLSAIFMIYNWEQYQDDPAKLIVEGRGDVVVPFQVNIRSHSSILWFSMTSPAMLAMLTVAAKEVVAYCKNDMGQTNAQRIAYVDQCPADYYLIWADRANCYQCQPFSKKNYFSENISTKTLMNMTDNVRPYSKEVESVWTLNSDWLSDREREEFESILISPYLYLYDTGTGLLHKVICQQTSWERKGKSNNKPHNMTIEVISDKKQNMIY